MPSIPVKLVTFGVSGLLVRARVYDSAGNPAEAADHTMIETPALSGQYIYSGTATLADNSGPFYWEARAAATADALGYENSITVLQTNERLGWVINGILIDALTDVRALNGAGPVGVAPTVDAQVVAASAQGRADIAAAVLDDATASHASAGTVGEAIAVGGSGGGGGSPTGTGADQVTLRFYSDPPANTAPIADADVWVTNDADGANVVAGTLQTNSQGEAEFLLDAGVTYYVWMQKDGDNPILGESFVAAAD
jgi:hypothetical protein